MSNLNINVSANTKQATDALVKLERQIEKTGKSASKAGNSTNDLLDDIKGFATNKLKGFDKWGITDKLGGLNKLGNIGKLAGKGGIYGAMAAAAVSPLIALHANVNEKSNRGLERYNQETGINASLTLLNKNLGGSGNVQQITKELMNMGLKGKVPIEELTKTAQRLSLSFKGNQQEALKWTKIVADMSAATGESADMFADLIARAEQFGTVEMTILETMNEFGIPIFQKLSDELGVSVEEAKKLAEQGRITASQFERAVEAAHAVSVAGSNQNSVVKNAEYWQKLRTEEQNAYFATTYTKPMQEMLARQEAVRYSRDKEYYENSNVQTMHEVLAENGTKLCNVIEEVKNYFSELGYIMSGSIADLIAWINSFNGYQVNRANKAQNAISYNILGLNGQAIRNKQTLSQYASGLSVADLSSRISELQGQIKVAENALLDPHIDEKTRQSGYEAVKNGKYVLEILNQTLAKKQEELRIEKERQLQAIKSKELQKQFLLDNAKTSFDYIEAWNLINPSNKLKTVDDVTKAVNASKQRLAGGTGNEFDNSLVSHFKPMFAHIEENTQKEKARQQFLLQQEAKESGFSGTKAKYQLSINSLIEQMQKLGFDNAAIKETAKEEQTNLLSGKRSTLSNMLNDYGDLAGKIRNYEKALNSWDETRGDRGMKTEFERGAWGQSLQLQTHDPAYLAAQNQLQQMKETNKKLTEQITLVKQEISAINRLNITPRAI